MELLNYTIQEIPGVTATETLISFYAKVLNVRSLSVISMNKTKSIHEPGLFSAGLFLFIRRYHLSFCNS